MTSHFSCLTTEDPLSRTAAFLTGYVKDNQLADEVLDNLRIIADELISNSIKYGEASTLALTIESDASRLKLSYKDDGKPFNPLSADSPDLDVPLADREIGGLGLLMIQAMSESRVYERTEDMNVLVLTLLIE